jgi:hypothetical protein
MVQNGREVALEDQVLVPGRGQVSAVERLIAPPHVGHALPEVLIFP